MLPIIRNIFADVNQEIIFVHRADLHGLAGVVGVDDLTICSDISGPAIVVNLIENHVLLPSIVGAASQIMISQFPLRK